MSTTLQVEALKMKHYKHNTISTGIEDEAPQAQHYKEERKQCKNI